MSQPLYVAFTMDCERIVSESPPGGPETWELSERTIRGYADTLLGFGAKPILVPECAEKHTTLFRDYANQGVELGLHTHPQSFLDHHYTQYLAEYDLDTQSELIALGKEVVANAVGTAPRAYRAGNLSSNGDTFTALVELGFDVASNSSPGRDVSTFEAHWLGADPDAHWANADDYMASGDLPCLEIPLTTNPKTRQPDGDSRDVRIERGTFTEWHLPALENTFERMEG
jgi:peptidoglycan/xylan/chitin deacetylase (PgdA/CDA1 family)